MTGGRRSTSQTYETPSDHTATNPGTGGSGGSGSSGGGGGGGGGGAASDQAKNTAQNLAPIVRWNQDTLTNKVGEADKIYDTANKNNDALRDFQMDNAEKHAGSEWYRQQQKLQSAFSSQRNKMGNAMYGSSLQELADLTEKIDDMQDSETLDALNESWDDIESDYWKAIMQTNNARNEFYLDSEEKLRDLVSDYAAQLANLDSGIARGEEEGFDKLIDVDNRTLNPPDWLRAYENFFDKHMVGPIKIKPRGSIRGGGATQKAWDNGLHPSNPGTSQSSTQSYFDRVMQGYENRR